MSKIEMTPLAEHNGYRIDLINPEDEALTLVCAGLARQPVYRIELSVDGEEELLEQLLARRNARLTKLRDMTCVYCGLIDCPDIGRGQHRRAGEVPPGLPTIHG